MKQRLARIAVLIAMLLTMLGIGGHETLALYHVSGNSMNPAMADGDQVLVNRFAYRWSEPRAGDLVVAGNDRNLPGFVVKRVVAVGGQRIAIQDGQLVVDNRPLDEEYLPDGTRTECAGNACNLMVPEGMVYLLGDNRSESFDSRVVGPVPVSDIVGEVMTTF